MSRNGVHAQQTAHRTNFVEPRQAEVDGALAVLGQFIERTPDGERAALADALGQWVRTGDPAQMARAFDALTAPDASAEG